MNMRRVGCVLLCLSIALSALPVRAEETTEEPAPREFLTDALAGGYDTGKTVSLSGTLSIKKALKLTDAAKSLADRLLESASFALSFSSSAYSLSLLSGGEEYLRLEEAETDAGCVTAVNGYSLCTEEGLFEAGLDDFLSFSACADAACETARLVEGAYDVLYEAEECTEMADRTRFSRGGRSRTRMDRSCSPALARTAFEPYAEAFLAACPRGVLSCLPRGLAFTDDAVFSVYRTQDGSCLAVTVNGTVAAEEKTYTLSFRADTGESGTALFCSLTGADKKELCSFSLDMSGERKDAALSRKLTVKTTETVNGKKKNTETVLSLSEKLKAEASDLSITLTVKTTENGKTMKWTVTPKLTVSGESGSGTVTFSHKADQTVDLSGTLTLLAFSIDDRPPFLPDGGSTETVRDPETALLLAEGELLKGLSRYMASLPEEDFLLFTHEARTEEWTELFSGRAITPQDWAVE